MVIVLASSFGVCFLLLFCRAASERVWLVSSSCCCRVVRYYLMDRFWKKAWSVSLGFGKSMLRATSSRVAWPAYLFWARRVSTKLETYTTAKNYGMVYKSSPAACGQPLARGYYSLQRRRWRRRWKMRMWSTKDTSSSSILGSDYLTSLSC